MIKYRLRLPGSFYVGGMMYAGKYGRIKAPAMAVVYTDRAAADAAAKHYESSWVEEYDTAQSIIKEKPCPIL